MVVVAAGFAVDIYTSRKQPYYGLVEGNSWWRDKYGYFGPTSMMKYMAVLAGIETASVLCLLYVPGDSKYVGVLIICVLTTALPLGHGLNNFKMMRNGRKHQLEEWEELGKLVRKSQPTELFWHMAVPSAAAGRARYRLFGWIYAEYKNDAEKQAAFDRIEGQIELMAAMGPFPLK